MTTPDARDDEERDRLEAELDEILAGDLEPEDQEEDRPDPVVVAKRLTGAALRNRWTPAEVAAAIGVLTDESWPERYRRAVEAGTADPMVRRDGRPRLLLETVSRRKRRNHANQLAPKLARIAVLAAELATTEDDYLELEETAVYFDQADAPELGMRPVIDALEALVARLREVYPGHPERPGGREVGF